MSGGKGVAAVTLLLKRILLTKLIFIFSGKISLSFQRWKVIIITRGIYFNIPSSFSSCFLLFSCCSSKSGRSRLTGSPG